MDFKSLLITGGAGFVGSNLAVLFKQAYPQLGVTAMDNLKRRGSELNLSRLDDGGVRFIHGDVRCAEDFEPAGDFDLLVDCAAEPSVEAGQKGSPIHVVNTNLTGTIHCLEAARQRGSAFLLVSTSRVYPVDRINGLPFREGATRYDWDDTEDVPGFTAHGVAEDFPLEGPRSFYGASKLASELLLREYVHAYAMQALINRCGVLAGPGQMARQDQGVVTHWIASHEFRRPLRYIGFDGAGKQVRDILAVEDLFDLLQRQLKDRSRWSGQVYNIGGGRQVSLSLLELTTLCESVTGNRIPITPVSQTSEVDIRIFLTDTRKAEQDFGWRPTRTCEQIVTSIHEWLRRNRDVLEPILGRDRPG